MNLYKKIKDWLHKKEEPEEEIEEQEEPVKPKRKKYEGICEYCNQKIKDYLEAFHCPYCKKWHCQKHRLPEKHGCKNPTKPNDIK